MTPICHVFGIRTWKLFFWMHDIGEFLRNTIPYALWIANHILTSTRNHKRKCEINRSSAYHIPPKRVNGWNPSSYFFLPTFNAWRRNGGLKPSLLKFRPMDNIPTIMNYELSGRPQGSAPTGKSNFSDVFPNNYELWITNYELTMTRTSVRLFYVAFQIFFEFFFVNGVFSQKKLQI